MSKRSSTWQKTTALIPLALLSAAWTANLSVSGASANSNEASTLPDGSSVPTRAITAPASVSSPGEIAPGVPAGTQDRVISAASTNGIPAAALAAYQRAAQVIDSADAGCNIDWPLIAAIGRVESDHGRYGGNVLSTEGVSSPGIYGISLDGTNGTAKITDTDAGQYDNDQIFDRAVGPMQFIPSTWSVVGVDGDGDGERNPQDIDDSALATAVYLCSGSEDLSTDAGVDSAVFRYNHSDAYVALVKAVAAAYSAGEYYAAPTSSYAPTYFAPSYDDSVFDDGTRGGFSHENGPKDNPNAGDKPASSGGKPATPKQPTPPAAGGNEVPKAPADPADPLKDVVTKVPKAVENTLTELQKATAYCQANLTQAELDLLGGLAACTQAYLDGGVNAVTGLLDSLGLGDLIGGLLPKP